jgi:hypothetical protein
MTGFTYDGITTNFTDFSFVRSGRHPYRFKVSGALRPIVIFKVIDDMLKHNLKRSFEIDCVDILHGRPSKLSIECYAKDYAKYKISGVISEFDFIPKSNMKKMDNNLIDNICISYNTDLYIDEIQQHVYGFKFFTNPLNKMKFTLDCRELKMDEKQVCHNVKIIFRGPSEGKINAIMQFQALESISSDNDIHEFNIINLYNLIY